jgi:hypothetical protein
MIFVSPNLDDFVSFCLNLQAAVVIAEHARCSLPVRHSRPPSLGLLSLYHEKKSSVQQLSKVSCARKEARQERREKVNARICPRLLPRPIGNSDIAYPQMMHKEPFTVRPPEAVCKKAREFFRS